MRPAQIVNCLHTIPPGYVCLFLAALVIISGIPVIGLAAPAEPVVVTICAQYLPVPAPALIVIVTTAAVLGDFISYQLGQRWGRRLATPARIRKHGARLRKSHRTIHQRGGRAVLLQRWVPPSRGFIPMFAGSTSMPLPRFLCLSALASTLWASVLIVGARLDATVLMVVLAGIPLVILGSAVWPLFRRLSTKPAPATGNSGLPSP